MKKEEKKKMTFKEKLKDKREKAKLELALYGIIFVVIIIFARFTSAPVDYIPDTSNEESFINKINDNYEYKIIVTINETNYEYYGKVLGNNASINFKEEDNIKTYNKMNKKYYILENENYILTEESEVFPYIDYHYLNIVTIKDYLLLAEKENNQYKVKIADIITDSENNEYITINIKEEDKNLIIDYTNLLSSIEENINKVIVNINYNNIGNVISTEE